MTHHCADHLRAALRDALYAEAADLLRPGTAQRRERARGAGSLVPGQGAGRHAGAGAGGGAVRPRLLDLFCGAGGCSVGYARASFLVDGVDKEPHPDYPFEIVVDDAMSWLDRLLAGKEPEPDVIHASPPCPRYSEVTPATNRDSHPDLLGPVRGALRAWGGAYVMENVPGAPMENPTLYCGGAFGLGATCRDGIYRPLQRHRLFESNIWLMSPGCACDHREKLGVYGTGGGGRSTRPSGGGGYKAWPEEARVGMDVPWITRRDDLSDAIPPVYTEHIGAQLLDHLAASGAA